MRVTADYRSTGSALHVPLFLALKAEVLSFADRPAEALEAISEAEGIQGHWWSAELHRLRGVFLATLGAEETQVEASFRDACRIANEQKSVSLKKRAEVSYAEYHERASVSTSTFRTTKRKKIQKSA